MTQLRPKVDLVAIVSALFALVQIPTIFKVLEDIDDGAGGETCHLGEVFNGEIWILCQRK